MPTPFPGMDPYLERRSFWREIHLQLIAELARRLNPVVRPRYRVATEQHTYTLTLLGSDEMVVDRGSGRGTVLAVAPLTVMPTVAELPMPETIIERYLAVRDTQTNEVITAIEILSPTNKLAPDARQQYEKKRLKVLGSNMNLVEIDLLRRGQPMSMNLLTETPSHYRLLVSRAQERPRAAIYLFSVRQPIPIIPIPLRPGEFEPTIDLNTILHELYDILNYDLVIDYQHEAAPPLTGQNAEWADALLRAQGLRK